MMMDNNLIETAFNTDMGLIQEEAERYTGQDQKFDEIIERFLMAACELRAYSLERTGADDYYIKKEWLMKAHTAAWQKLCQVWRNEELEDEGRRVAEEEYMDALRALEMHKR